MNYFYYYYYNVICLLYLKLNNADISNNKNSNNRLSLERLLKRIYIDDDYNSEVRPFGSNDLTKVETDLKLLQIDLDEKFQEL